MYGKLFLSALLFLLLQACTESSKQAVSEIDFGETTYFKPFLGVKCESDTLSKILELEFNKAPVFDALGHQT